MARGGVNKALVKIARDALIARGENPSIDAIRVELGNTGSKTTISNCVAELAEEEAGRKGRVLVGEAVSHLAERLAAQLQEDAQATIAEAESRFLAATNVFKAQTQIDQETIKRLGKELNDSEQKLGLSQSALQSLQSDHQRLIIQSEKTSQQLTEKITQLADKTTHIESLEEKHQHSRQALEHFRTMAKDQRDQESRRHEQQVQELQSELRKLSQLLSIKQTDITQLNTDNARLAAELGDARKQLNEVTHFLKLSENRVLEALTNAAVQEKENQQLKKQLNDLQQINDALTETSSHLNVELIETKAELKVKDQLFESLKPPSPTQ